MKVYLVERTDWIGYCDDYAMVVIAKDALHAERKARWSSNDFRKCQGIKVTEISLNEESAVLIANKGG